MEQSCTVTLLLNWQKRSKAALLYSTFTGDLTLQISATSASVTRKMCSRVYTRLQRALWANSNKLNRKAHITKHAVNRFKPYDSYSWSETKYRKERITNSTDSGRNLLLSSMNQGDHTQQSAWTYLDLDNHVINSHSTYILLPNNINWPYQTWQGAQQILLLLQDTITLPNLPMQPNKEQLEDHIYLFVLLDNHELIRTIEVGFRPSVKL